MATKKKIEFYSYDAYPTGLIKASSMLKQFQQIAREDLDSFGITYPKMREDGVVFVLIKLRMKLYEKLSIYEKLSLETIPIKISGIYFIRDFFLRRDDGTLVGEASSSWVLIDYQTRRPQRPGVMNYNIPHCEDICADISLSRTFVQEGDAASEKRKVRLSDMDENGHLNNAVIADYVTDEFADEIVLCGKYVKDIEIHFHKEGKLGNEIVLNKLCSDGNSFVIDAKFEDTGECAFLSRIELF